jgi:hypothetical protein
MSRIKAGDEYFTAVMPSVFCLWGWSRRDHHPDHRDCVGKRRHSSRRDCVRRQQRTFTARPTTRCCGTSTRRGPFRCRLPERRSDGGRLPYRNDRHRRRVRRSGGARLDHDQRRRSQAAGCRCETVRAGATTEPGAKLWSGWHPTQSSTGFASLPAPQGRQLSRHERSPRHAGPELSLVPRCQADRDVVRAVSAAWKERSGPRLARRVVPTRSGRLR